LSATVWRLGLVGLVGVTVGLAAEGVANPSEPGQWILDLATGWILIGCGLVAVWKRPESRVGWLLAATGFAWFLGNFAEVSATAIAWLAAHAVYLHRGPLVHLLSPTRPGAQHHDSPEAQLLSATRRRSSHRSGATKLPRSSSPLS
jgi:hypothetical protein